MERKREQHRYSVFCIQGGGGRTSLNVNGNGWNEDVCFTLNALDVHAIVYERHDQESRYKPIGDVSETVSAKYGTGGGNTPIVLIKYEEDDMLCREEIL